MSEREKALAEVERAMSELLLDIYNDRVYHGVADPLSVVLEDGNSRMKHVKWLQDARMNLWVAMSHDDEGPLRDVGDTESGEPVATTKN